MEGREVLVPGERWARWRENFVRGHGETRSEVVAGALRGDAADGSWFEARRPLGEPWHDDEPAPTGSWGVLLARKGGFAVARLDGTRVVAQKVGRRHVQGRTKAGGQSQQRFARRRENQARAAYDAAAEHAVTVLAGTTRVVTGGDREAVAAVLADPRLARVQVLEPWLAVADPRSDVLLRAVLDAGSVRVRVHNA